MYLFAKNNKEKNFLIHTNKGIFTNPVDEIYKICGFTDNFNYQGLFEFQIDDKAPDVNHFT